MTRHQNANGAAEDLRLLIVDDDEIDVQAVVRAVRRARLPLGLYSAREGDEALELLRSQRSESDKPFLVLLDLNMPGRNGFEFLEQLRADERIRQSIVFVLTTSNRASDKERAYEHLVAGYLVKSDLGPRYDRLVDLIQGYTASVKFPEA